MSLQHRQRQYKPLVGGLERVRLAMEMVNTAVIKYPGSFL